MKLSYVQRPFLYPLHECAHKDRPDHRPTVMRDLKREKTGVDC